VADYITNNATVPNYTATVESAFFINFTLRIYAEDGDSDGFITDIVLSNGLYNPSGSSMSGGEQSLIYAKHDRNILSQPNGKVTATRTDTPFGWTLDGDLDDQSLLTTDDVTFNTTRSAYFKSSPAIITANGTTQEDGTLLTTGVNNVFTVTTGVNDGVRLPPATADMVGTIIEVATIAPGETLKIYPYLGDIINVTGGPNLPVTVETNPGGFYNWNVFQCVGLGIWGTRENQSVIKESNVTFNDVNVTADLTVNGTFSAVGLVVWDTGAAKTTGFTAESGKGYFCDTETTGAFTVTLPASPTTIGETIKLKDATNYFATANLTIDPGANKIEGLVQTIDLVTDSDGVEITWSGPNEGWKFTSRF
jgi:hypothetical protein